MTIQKFYLFCLLSLSLIFSNQVLSQSPQILQVYTQFRSIIGEPTWLLIIRDVQTGKVSPYMFDIKKEDNFWVAFTPGRIYQITASSVKFGPYAKIKNFCQLQNGYIDSYSYRIILKGDLSPDSKTYKCFVSKYKNTMPFVTAYPQS